MTAIESTRSRSRDGNGIELVIIVWDVADDSQAVSQAVALAPPQYLGLNRQKPRLRKLNDAYSLWEVIFPYSPLEVQSEEPGGGGGGEEDPPEGHIEFDGSGTTAHITQSIATVNVEQLADEEPGEPTQVIGWRKEGGGIHVEGTDVPVPGSIVTVTRHFEPDEIDGAYRRGLRNLRGKVNKFDYNIDGTVYAPGELLFLFARGSKRGKREWEITLHFDEDESREVKVVPDKPKVTVPPHHYLWIQYRHDTDTAGKQLLAKPVFAFVERIYDEADFGAVIDGLGALP